MWNFKQSAALEDEASAREGEGHVWETIREVTSGRRPCSFSEAGSGMLRAGSRQCCCGTGGQRPAGGRKESGGLIPGAALIKAEPFF